MEYDYTGQYCITERLRNILMQAPGNSSETTLFTWNELYLSVRRYVQYKRFALFTPEQHRKKDFDVVNVSKDTLGSAFGVTQFHRKSLGEHLYKHVVPYRMPRVHLHPYRRGRNIGQRLCTLRSHSVPEKVRWKADLLVQALINEDVLERIPGGEERVSEANLALQGGYRIRLMVDYIEVNDSNQTERRAMGIVPLKIAFPRKRQSTRDGPRSR